MKRITIAVVLAAGATTLLASRAAGADKSFTASATHDCTKDREVSINASSGTFTFTGACDKISINGHSNKIVVASVKKIAFNGSRNVADIGAADRISLNGSENTVTYGKGLSSGKPKIGGVGAKNTVAQK